MRYEFDETKVDDVIRAAYDLSTPQGLGFLHARPGGLDDETIARIKESESGLYAASMDYVHGRAVKLTIRRDGDICYIPADSWFDHSLDHLRELAKRADLGEPKATGEV